MTVRFKYSTQMGFAFFDFIYDFLPLKNNIIVLTNSNSDKNKFLSTMTTIPSWRIVFQGKSMAHKSKHDMVKAAEARRIKSNTHVSPTIRRHAYMCHTITLCFCFDIMLFVIIYFQHCSRLPKLYNRTVCRQIVYDPCVLEKERTILVNYT